MNLILAKKIKKFTKDITKKEGLTYILLWQLSIIIATREWTLLLICLAALLIIDIPTSMRQITKEWFSINNWVVALGLTMLYTMIGKDIADNSSIFYFKRLLLIGINGISFSYMLNEMRECREKKISQNENRLNLRKVIIYISQVCISILVLGGYLKNPASGSNQFDMYLGINGASQIIALICLLVTVVPILKVRYCAKIFLQSCLFSITTILLISASQSRITSAVMMTIIIFLTGYVTERKILKKLGLIVTAGWSVYYSIILPILVVLAPTIHQQPAIVKVLYTITGSRYSLAWSGNMWHENGLNLLNSEIASSKLPFLQNSYYTSNITENYGSALIGSKKILETFIPNGPHSMPIDLLLGLTKVIDSFTIPLYVWGLSGLLLIILITEYYTSRGRSALHKEDLMVNLCFNALTLSVITTQTQGTIYLPFALSTSIILISHSKKPRLRFAKRGKVASTILNDNNDRLYIRFLLFFSSPLLILMPFVIYGTAYLLARIIVL